MCKADLRCICLMGNELWSLEIFLFSDLFSALFLSLKPTYNYNTECLNKSREVTQLFCYENIGNEPFETASDSVNTGMPEKLTYISRMKKHITDL